MTLPFGSVHGPKVPKGGSGGEHVVHEPPVLSDGRGGTASSVLFEELGIRYIGPLDGHNLPLMIKSLEYAQNCEHPVVLHVLTKKGKGYNAA